MTDLRRVHQIVSAFHHRIALYYHSRFRDLRDLTVAQNRGHSACSGPPTSPASSQPGGKRQLSSKHAGPPAGRLSHGSFLPDRASQVLSRRVILRRITAELQVPGASPIRHPWGDDSAAGNVAVSCMGAADLMGVRDEPSVSASVAHLRRLVAAEVAAGTPESRIVIGGFSQGGHVSLRAGGLLHPHPPPPDTQEPHDAACVHRNTGHGHTADRPTNRLYNQCSRHPLLLIGHTVSTLVAD